MIWTLLRVFFKERFGFQRLFGRSISSSPIKKILMGLLLVYALGVTSFSLGFIHYEFALLLLPSGQFDSLLLQMNSYMMGIAFLFSFFQARGSLYGYKDFDFLGSLPIQKTTLIIAKWFLMYTFILLFGLLVTLPILVVYLQFVTVPLVSIILGFVAFLFLPLPVMILGVLLSIGIYEVTKNWINPKIMQSILMVLFLLAYITFQFVQSSWLESGEIAPWLNDVFSWYAPQTWVVEAFQGNLVSFAILVLSHAGLVVFALWAMSGTIYRLNQSQQTQRTKVSKESSFLQKTPILHLVSMEWKRFIMSPIYLLNTGFGIVMLIIGSVAMLFIPNIADMLEVVEAELGLSAQAIWLVFVGFTLSTVYSPAVSLSLEGKNIQLLKTLPLPYFNISLAKILFNIVLIVPMLTLSHVIVSLVLEIPFLESFLTWLLLLLASGLFSVFFHWVNVFFPRFDFQQDVEVVKQSLAALIAVFGGFGLTALLVTSYMVWLNEMDPTLRLLVLSGAVFVSLVALLYGLKKFADRFYEGFSV